MGFKNRTVAVCRLADLPYPAELRDAPPCAGGSSLLRIPVGEERKPPGLLPGAFFQLPNKNNPLNDPGHLSGEEEEDKIRVWGRVGLICTPWVQLLPGTVGEERQGQTPGRKTEG